MSGRPPTPGRSDQQAAHAEAERQRYQSLAPADRRAVVLNRDREAQQAADRRRRARDPQGRNEAQAQSRTVTDPAKTRAQAIAKTAVATGTIKVPAKCQSCGSAAPLQMHHDDYSKPMAVKHLCATCHGAQHQAAPDTPFGQSGRVGK